MTTLDDLWPECPVCGSKHVELGWWDGPAVWCTAPDRPGWFFYCGDCDTEGQTRDTIEAAKAAFEGMRE